ncbi:MAG: histidinol-phosphate transaminase [Methanosarcinaceae archaeon]|nr:histidinol-phosphate transaminase [Methanosarcinaceae archaeon]
MSRPELIKKEIFSIAEYVPGKSIEEIAAGYGLDPGKIIKLGSNENPLGPSPAAVEALCREASKVNLYPSADARELRIALSKYTGLPLSNLVASGPGMDGLLDGLCRLLIEKGDEVIIPTPTFAYYELPARACGGKAVFVPREADYSVVPEKILAAESKRTKLIFLCSPNNPSGNSLSEGKLRQILENTKALVFVDEAYVEFASRNFAALVLEYDNLIIGRTFSKAFGLAGLRLGYGLLPEWLLREYLRVATPFNVSLPAQKAGIAALSDQKHLIKSIELVQKGRVNLINALPFKVYPSEANFVLVDVAPLKSKTVVEALLKKGIIVRSCDSFRAAGDTLIRVTVGTPEQNEKLIEAFKAIKTEFLRS